MEKELRKTGIDIIGNVSWGTHFCQFYQTPGDLIDILVLYFKAGLENNEFCMWITAKPLNAKKAKASLKKIVRNLDDYIEKGQIEILDCSQWYTKSGKFDADGVLDSWVKKENQALEGGFDGLRIAGNTYWLEDNDWKSFREYEETLNNIIGNYKMLVVCSYSLDKCNAAEIMDVVAKHRFALVKRKNSWKIIEISERRWAEEALINSEQEKSAILGTISEHVVYRDKNMKVLWANRAAGESVGLAPEQLMGRYCYEIWHQRSKPCVVCPAKETLKTGQPKEEEVTTPDGRIWWIRTYPIRDANGDIVGIANVTLNITDSKQAEEALRESEKKYRTLFENMVQGAFYQRADGVLVDGNPAVLEMFGLTPDQFLGRTSMDPRWKVIHEDGSDFPGEQHPSIEALRTGKPVRGVVAGVFNPRKEDYVWLNINAIPQFKLGEDKPYQVFVTLHDITTLKHAEEALRKSEEFSSSLLSNSPNPIVVINHDTSVQYVNPVLERITGFSSKELIGIKVPYPWWTKETLKKTQSDFEEAISRGVERREELFQKKNGERFWVEITSRPIIKSGEFQYYLANWVVITERKQAEEEREKLEAQLFNAMEIAHLGPWEYDVTSDLFIFNDQFYKMFRTTAEQAGGYKMASDEYAKRFLHPDDMHLVREENRKAFETTDPDFKRQLEHRILYADGEVGYITVRYFIVKDDQGKTVRTYGVNQDITDRRRMEEEILKTEKLESLGILAGGIAHDFNNILTTILANVSMAKDQADPGSETFELLSEAETASKRAQTLTKQLLTFAKGGTPVKEAASVGDIIKDSSLFVIHGSKSGCAFSIAQDLWPVEIDMGQISQVINNIVINANQAMPEGGIIEIKAENLIIGKGDKLQLKPGRYIRVSVKDEGVGIAENHLSKIFDPYFTTKQEGSGLGLATAYSIIKKHGGIIMAESLLGISTTFHIYLPASEKGAPEKRKKRVIKGRGKILVMDDEASLRKIVGRMLDRLGYEPEFAKHGDEAIRMVEEAKEAKKPYDVVILDLTVPGGMGGKETIQKLLEIDPETKAIVSSGYSDDPVLANFQGYGFKGMLPKPFESLSLSKVLHEVLQSEKE